MTTNPDSAAFPYLYGEDIASEEGLSKRELFAAMVLQGILASPQTDRKRDEMANEAAFDAVMYADALIKELNEG